MAQVMGTPFDRVQCPTATLGNNPITVTAPVPRYMRPYDSGVRNGDPVTLLIEEGNDFELVEATARNCTAQSCEFTRNLVRFSSIGGVISQASLSLKGAARVSIVAGAADLNVHRGGTITGNVVLNGDLSVSGSLTAPNLPAGPQGPQGEAGQQGPQGPQGVQGSQGAAGTGITMKGSLPTQGDLPAGATQGDAYIVQADDSLWIYDGTKWVSGGSIQGPPGAQGPQGPQGVAGQQGPQGQQGAQGPQGQKGDPGTPGTQGPAGAQGQAGPSAVSANAGNLAKLGTDSLIYVPNTGPIKGITDGSDAAAGMVGEVISSSNFGGVSLTTAVAMNVTQISLTPGDWNVGGVVIFSPTNTGPNSVIAALSQTAATLPSDNDVATGKAIMQQIWASSMPSNKTQTTPTSLIRVNTTTLKTVYLVAWSTFGGGSVSVTGYISARRIR